MIRDFEPLTSSKKEGAVCARPTQVLLENVDLGDPAIDVMTDLTKISAVSVHSHAPMDIANAKMIQYGVRMLLVIDGSNQIAGLITANDVLGDKPMRHLQNFGGTYTNIKVSDLMTSFRELDVVRLEEVQHAKVGQIIMTLKKSGRQHGLVVTESGGKQTVCGIFSATQIARQMKSHAHNPEVSHALSIIESIIANG